MKNNSGKDRKVKTHQTNNRKSVATEVAVFEPEVTYSREAVREEYAQQPESEPTYDNHGSVFRTLGTMENFDFSGSCDAPVAEGLRRAFHEGHRLGLSTEVNFEYRQGYPGGYMDPTRLRPQRHPEMQIRSSMPRVEVVQIEQGGKVVGVAFVNKGIRADRFTR